MNIGSNRYPSLIALVSCLVDFLVNWLVDFSVNQIRIQLIRRIYCFGALDCLVNSMELTDSFSGGN